MSVVSQIKVSGSLITLLGSSESFPFENIRTGGTLAALSSGVCNYISGVGKTDGTGKLSKLLAPKRAPRGFSESGRPLFLGRALWWAPWKCGLKGANGKTVCSETVHPCMYEWKLSTREGQNMTGVLGLHVGLYNGLLSFFGFVWLSFD